MKGFRELVQLHLANEADRLAAKKQDELNRRITALEEDVAGAKVRLEMAEADVKRLHLERKTAELDVQKLEDQRTKYRAQLMTAKTNEIYRTLISEIETTARQISERETKVIEVMEQADGIAAAAAEAKRDLAKAESLRAAEEAKLRADIAALQAERDAARAKAAELEPQIERALLAQYKRIAAGRDGRGMALALGYECTACHISIRPQDWVDMLEPEKPSICEGCRRILYRADAQAPGSAA